MIWEGVRGWGSYCRGEGGKGDGNRISMKALE